MKKSMRQIIIIISYKLYFYNNSNSPCGSTGRYASNNLTNFHIRLNALALSLPSSFDIYHRFLDKAQSQTKDDRCCVSWTCSEKCRLRPSIGMVFSAGNNFVKVYDVSMCARSLGKWERAYARKSYLYISCRHICKAPKE